MLLPSLCLHINKTLVSSGRWHRGIAVRQATARLLLHLQVKRHNVTTHTYRSVPSLLTHIGDIINGTMVYQKGEWVITTANLRTGKSTVLRVSTQEVLNEYFVTLETYNIASCADYPDGGSTLFTGLYATDSAGPVPLQWDIDQLDGTCNENAVVVNQTAVAIQYGGSSSSNRRGRK